MAGIAVFSPQGANLFKHGQLLSLDGVDIFGALSSIFHRIDLVHCLVNHDREPNDGPCGFQNTALRQECNSSMFAALDCCGQSFIPFFFSSTSIYATSKYKRMGMVACRYSAQQCSRHLTWGSTRVPFGLLVAVCAKPTPCQRLVTCVERVCHGLRS